MDWLPLVFLLTFGVVVLVIPLVRTWVRHRKWGVARGATPVHRAMVGALLSALVAAAGWAVLLPIVGPERLDVWPAPTALSWVGIGAAVGGMVLISLAQAQMGASWRIGIPSEKTGLITHGLFSSIRHPIYTGLGALLLALVFVSPSPWTFMASGWLLSLIAIEARLEEQHLDTLHGADFRSWAATTGRFVPGFGRLRPSGGA